MSLNQNVNLKEADKYVLSIRLSTKDAIVVIEEAKDEKNILFNEKYSFDSRKTVFENVKEIIFENPFITQSFSKVNIINAINHYSIVPSRYFEKSIKSQIYNYVNNTEEKMIVYFNEVDYREVIVISACDKYLHGFLNRNLNHPIFYSSIFPQLKYIYSLRETYFRNMYIIEDNGSINVIAFENKDLKICRTLFSQDEQENLYFILKIWETLNWNQENDRLYLYGNISSYIEKELREFLHNVTKLKIEVDLLMAENKEYSILDFKLLAL